MLTAKQKSLFKLLDIAEDREAEMRRHHKLVRQLGASADFTTWLNKCLQARWRQENTRIYVGD